MICLMHQSDKTSAAVSREEGRIHSSEKKKNKEQSVMSKNLDAFTPTHTDCTHSDVKVSCAQGV